MPKEFLFIYSLACSLLIYYFLFYIYVYSPFLGHIVLVALMVVSPVQLFSIVRDLNKDKKELRLLRQFYFPPLVITAVFFVIYSSLLYSCRPLPLSRGGYDETSNTAFCHISNLPFDNALPFIYANNVIKNQERVLLIDWSIADRPPLQIATAIPTQDLTRNINQYYRFFLYNIMSIFLQLSWVAAVWAILIRLKFSRKLVLMTIIGFGATGFFYLNSVFVWPKLLAAALTISGMVIYIDGVGKKINYRYLPFSALLISLGLLSHTGVAFTVLPFTILFLYLAIRQKSIQWRYVLLAATIGMLLLLPWQLYKGSLTSFDRLSKYHFAGVTSYSDKRGTVQTIVDQYKATSLNEWEHTKTTNIKTLVTGGRSLAQNCPFKFNGLLKKCSLAQWRSFTFFSTFFALELFGLGLFALIHQAYRRKLDLFDRSVVFMTIAYLALWVLIMFVPGGTIVHQGSYASMLLLFILCAKQLAKYSGDVITYLSVLQIFIFSAAWILPFYFR